MPSTFCIDDKLFLDPSLAWEPIRADALVRILILEKLICSSIHAAVAV